MPGEVWGPVRAPKETSAHSRHMWSAAGVSARPQPSTPTPVLAAVLDTGLEGNGLQKGRLHMLCNLLLPSQQLPPPSDRTAQHSGSRKRHPTPHPGPKAPSSLNPQISWKYSVSGSGWASLSSPWRCHTLREKQVPLHPSRGTPHSPWKPGSGRREERPQCWSWAPQGTPAPTSALRPGSATHLPPCHSLMCPVALGTGSQEPSPVPV